MKEQRLAIVIIIISTFFFSLILLNPIVITQTNDTNPLLPIITGTATPTNPVIFGDYRLYSDIGNNNAWAQVIIKNSVGTVLEKLIINQGETKTSAASNLNVKVIAVRALADGTIIGTDLYITVATPLITGTANATNPVIFEGYKIYATQGSNNVWSKIVVKNSADVILDTLIINEGETIASVQSGLSIKVIDVRALADGTTVGVDLYVTQIITGTADAVNPVIFGNYKLYATLGSNNIWAKIVVKNSANDIIDSLTINNGETRTSSVSGLDIKVVNVRALSDGTIVAVDLYIKEAIKVEPITGTANATTPVIFDNFKIYAIQGSDNVWARITVTSETEGETTVISVGETRTFSNSGLNIKVVDVRALLDGTTVGVDLYVTKSPIQLKPDLVFDSLVLWQPISNMPINEPDKIRVSAVIKNKGSANAGSFETNIFFPQLSTYNDDTACRGGLAAGATCTVVGYGYYCCADFGKSIKPGTYTAVVTIDSSSLVDESDETNNKRDASLTIGETIKEFNFQVKTDKYSYQPGDYVKVIAILSGDPSLNIDFANAEVKITIMDPNNKTHEINVVRLGGVSGGCVQSSYGYLCPIVSEYSFIGSYPLSYDAPSGAYYVNGVAKVGSNVKYADSNFVVSSTSIGDVFDIFIKPKEQHTIVGEPAKYSVTIVDKHTTACPPQPISEAGSIVPGSGGTGGGGSGGTACSVPVYYYLISVDGLPYHSVYPPIVSVSSGTITSFELTVYPSPTKTEIGVETAVQKPAAGNFTEERIVTPISGSAVTSTAMQSIESSEAVFKFIVQASLRNNLDIRDSDTAVLYVKFVTDPVPPPFPESEKIEGKLKKGWNLVNLPGKVGKFSIGTCSLQSKPTAFVYLPDQQKYVTILEAVRLLGQDITNYLSTHSFWVYSQQDCELSLEITSFATYSGLQLSGGWNLLGTTKDMVGDTLSNIKGACVFEKVYTWDADSQTWVKRSENDLIDQLGYGILVKTTSACNLKDNLIQPPEFPG